ncbi:MAG TPA: aminopeptidase [Syntrophales bacterium]|nr:aminopeptidase [Syntrophales bacterium]
MLSEKLLERYADVMIWGLTTARKKNYRKGEIVRVYYDVPAVRLAEILQEKLIGRGVHPVLRSGLTPTMEKNYFSLSGKDQLTFLAPGDRELCEHLNGSIYLYAPVSLTHLRDVDPKKIAVATVARKVLKDILDKRDSEGTFGWTLCMMPTSELARQAKLSMNQYEKQVIKACYLDRGDPVQHWEEIHRAVSGIKKWLNAMKVSFYHIEGNHVDLKITPGQHRKWLGVSGHNIPSFEIFLSPDWRGTEGRYYANMPSFRSGNYVAGAVLDFRKGVGSVVRADQGEEFTRKQIAMDEGARRVGEFSLTDRRFSRIDRFMANTLYDENFGGKYGNCHLAVGSSYADTYSKDPAGLTAAMKKRLGFNDSALHWDLVNTEPKTVTAQLATGKRVVVYEDGMFTY